MRERGAAERKAMLWHVYLTEEIFIDKKKFTIAAEGRGKRTGFRNQKKKLNLDQFVRHIWMSTDKGEECPPKYTYVWSIKIEEASTMSHLQIANAIARIKASENNTLSRHGFMGNLNALKVNGESDWFECMRKVKESIKHVKNMLKATDVDDIDNITRAHIVRCVEEAQEGCRRTIDLRRKKIWQCVRIDIKNGLDIQKVAEKSHKGLAKGEQYNRPNRKLTFDDPQVWKKFDANEARFNAKWEEDVHDIIDFLEGDEHLKAIETFEELYVDIVDMQPSPFTSFAEEIEELALGLDDYEMETEYGLI